MRIIRGSEDAVSPVVGIMLMLVVTIIIAAIVSGFAGGLAGDAKKTPQVNIKAEYSQSQGMTIHHLGGDTVNTLDTKVFVKPTRDFSSDYQTWEVNTSALMVNGKPWLRVGGYQTSNALIFEAGDIAIVEPADLDAGAVQPATYSDSDDTKGSAGFQDPNNRGKRFTLSLVDNSGKTIAQTEVTVRA